MEKVSPKDVFLNILSILTLYISAGSFLTLLFQYINIFFPDPLQHFYEVRNDLNFVLCGNFARPSPFYQESWEHQEGYTCFERKIDPEIYDKPRKSYPA